MLVEEIPVEERPREKAKKYGVQILSNVELLAIILRHGYQGKSSLSIASEIIKKANGIAQLSSLSLKDLKSIKGVKDVKGIEILACFELAKRIHYEKGLRKDVVTDPGSLIEWLKSELGDQSQENFLVVYLNVKNHIQGYRILFKGTADRSLVHPREVFKEALLFSSSKMMIVHNHPSGDLTPSEADIAMTNQLCDAANVMGMSILDHLIISRTDFFSFKANGLL